MKRMAPGEGLIVLPPDTGRKHSHLAFISHRGGGWYEVVCFGSARKCVAGECAHTRGMGFRRGDSFRPIRQVPRDTNHEGEGR